MVLTTNISLYKMDRGKYSPLPDNLKQKVDHENTFKFLSASVYTKETKHFANTKSLHPSETKVKWKTLPDHIYQGRPQTDAAIAIRLYLYVYLWHLQSCPKAFVVKGVYLWLIRFWSNIDRFFTLYEGIHREEVSTDTRKTT